MDAPLVDKEYLLERFPGKGGWTYISLPEIEKDKDAPFGIVKVSGTIDDVEIKQYSLMPYDNGSLLMAVKAEIRKKIGKEEGDYVQVTLYSDASEYQIPDELKNRFIDAGVYNLFTTYKKWEQRMCSQWIFSAKRPETVNERIIKTIFRVKHHERIYR
ncbi:MAG: YdeI/OmpD-associated family protein [Bacteroidota bacterium]